jgi:ribosome-associated protein
MALVYLKVTEDFVIDDHELEWQFSTSSGPGGQHANRTQTRAEVRWNVAFSTAGTSAQRRILSERFGQLITIRVDTHRSQKRNREEARDRLAAKIRQGLQVPTSRRNTRPSRSAKRKRVDAKARRGQLKKQRQRPSIDD